MWRVGGRGGERETKRERERERQKQNHSSVMKFGIKSAECCVIRSIPVIPELQMGRHGAVEMSSLSVVKKVCRKLSC
jgi:hypothetical protein